MCKRGTGGGGLAAFVVLVRIWPGFECFGTGSGGWKGDGCGPVWRKMVLRNYSPGALPGGDEGLFFRKMSLLFPVNGAPGLVLNRL